MNSLACSYYIKGFLCFQVLLQKKRADRNLPSYNVQLFTEVSLKKTCESLAVVAELQSKKQSPLKYKAYSDVYIVNSFLKGNRKTLEFRFYL
jgi:hypothetical protein